MSDWIDVCAAGEIDVEDVIRFDHGGRTFAIYRGPADDYFCTDGLCTHEHAHLADGLVTDHVIECPKHNGRFDYRTGQGDSYSGLRRSRHLPGQARRRARPDRRLTRIGEKLRLRQPLFPRQPGPFHATAPVPDRSD